MSVRRAISFTALASLSALAIGVPVAQATHPDDTMAEAECVLAANGVAGSAALGGENGVNSLMQDTGFGGGWDPVTMLKDTDPGHFNFQGNATCEGRDDASEANNKTAPELVPAGTYEIVASGDFDNHKCGTGTANGDAVIRGPLPIVGAPAVQIYTEFGIRFIGGVGGGAVPPYTGKLVFVVDADETGGGKVGGQFPTAPDGAETWAGAAITYPGHSYANENQIDGGMGTGDVTITPSIGNCITTNVTQFLVNGKFEGVLSGEGSDVSNAGNPAGNLDSDD